MTYMLIALVAGHIYVERRHLSLNECAAHSAILRGLTTEELEQNVGRVQYICIAEAKS